MKGVKTYDCALYKHKLNKYTYISICDNNFNFSIEPSQPPPPQPRAQPSSLLFTSSLTLQPPPANHCGQRGLWCLISFLSPASPSPKPYRFFFFPHPRPTPCRHPTYEQCYRDDRRVGYDGRSGSAT